MLIAVNTRFLIKDKLEGIGWFTFETMKRLTQNHPEHQFLFLFDRPYSEEFIFSSNIIPKVVWPPARHPYLWKYWFDVSLPKVFKKYKPDLFISTDGMLSLKTHIPSLLVIHDLGFEHYPEHTPGVVSKYYRRFTPLFAHKADRIVTVSEFSKNDIIHKYKIQPDKIDVVYNGANENYKPLGEEQKTKIRNVYTGGKNYFIYVGSIHPRKNVKNLLLAFEQFKQESKSDKKLIIAGRMAWKTENIETTLHAMLHKKEVLFTDHLQLNELTKVVAAADALVYPSYFEGFGIPVVEARYCNVPVICSNTSSLPEAAGKNALYFDPASVFSMRDALLKFNAYKKNPEILLHDDVKVRNEFNWNKTYMGLYESMMQIAKARYGKKKKIILTV